MNPDTLVVLGGGLKKEGGRWLPSESNRINAAWNLFKKGAANNIIVSGGTGPFTKFPDAPPIADLMEAELLKLGVPTGRIKKERESNNTYEQLLFVNKMPLKNIAFISTSAHLPRIKALINYAPALTGLSKRAKLISAEKILGLPEPKPSKLEMNGIKEIKNGKYRFLRFGNGHRVFIVAEISCNHRQNYTEAVKLVRAASKAGADAVKFQTYTADTMTLNSDKPWFIFTGNPKYKSERPTLYSIYQREFTPWDWQPKLKKIAEQLGLLWFSSPFDATAVDFLEKLDVPCYKIASYEATDIPLLKKVAKTKKPVIISSGFASQQELSESIGTLRKYGSTDIAVLHCLTSYVEKPDVSTVNFMTIPDIARRFNVTVGLSDNNGGVDLPVMAVLAGARIIEKHLNLNKDNNSANAHFSANPEEFKIMVKKIREAEKILGRIHYGPTNESEKYNRNFRRSLFTSRNIKKGDKFTSRNIKVIRPAYGLAPKYFDSTLGKTASQDIEFATPLKKGHVT